MTRTKKAQIISTWAFFVTAIDAIKFGADERHRTIHLYNCLY